MDETEAIIGSDLFLVLATPDYLEDLRNAGEQVTHQILIAKRHNKPVFLAIHNSLSESEVKELKTYFNSFKILGEQTFNPKDEYSLKKVALEAKKRLEEIIES